MVICNHSGCQQQVCREHQGCGTYVSDCIEWLFDGYTGLQELPVCSTALNRSHSQIGVRCRVVGKRKHSRECSMIKCILYAKQTGVPSGSASRTSCAIVVPYGCTVGWYTVECATTCLGITQTSWVTFDKFYCSVRMCGHLVSRLTVACFKSVSRVVVFECTTQRNVSNTQIE